MPNRMLGGINAMNSAANSGRRMMKVRLSSVAPVWLSLEREDHDDHDAHYEQEGISLQATRLHQAQGAAENLRRAMGPTHAQTRDDPAVEPVGQPGQGFVRES